MAQPNSRESIIQYAFRQLGAPVVEINVDQQQAQDRLDDALQFFSERHFDGVERAFFTYALTEQEVLAAIGKAAIEHVTQDDLVVLIGIGQAIKDGDANVDNVFRPKKVNAMSGKDIDPIHIKVTDNFDDKLKQATGKLEFE